MKSRDLKIIGREEWCAFGELKIPAILARIDSGARTSSIQARDMELYNKGDERWVRFDVYPIQKDQKTKVTCKAKIIGKRHIKGSFGISEERLIIKTPITVGTDTFEVQLTLANRNTMDFRMLLGREAISKRFLINPARTKVRTKHTKDEVAEMYKPKPKKS